MKGRMDMLLFNYDQKMKVRPNHAEVKPTTKEPREAAMAAWSSESGRGNILIWKLVVKLPEIL